MFNDIEQQNGIDFITLLWITVNSRVAIHSHTLSHCLPWTNGSRHPCQDDEREQNHTTPSFRQGPPEPRGQGWHLQISHRLPDNSPTNKPRRTLSTRRRAEQNKATLKTLRPLCPSCLTILNNKIINH